jgi:hypothetical protein
MEAGMKYKVTRLLATVQEVSLGKTSPGGPMIPTAQVILRGYDGGGEFTIPMEDAPRVGDEFTILILPGAVTPTIEGEL